MITLGNLIEDIDFVKEEVFLFGAEAKFQLEYDRRLNKIAETISREKKVKKTSVFSLAKDMVLGKQATQLVQQFRNWLITQHQDFKERFEQTITA